MNILHRYLTPCLLALTFAHSLSATTVTNPTACVLQKLAVAKQDITEIITALKVGEVQCFRDEQKEYNRSFRLEADEKDMIKVGLGALEIGEAKHPQSVRPQEFNIIEEADEFTKGHAVIEARHLSIYISITKIPRQKLLQILQQLHAATAVTQVAK